MTTAMNVESLVAANDDLTVFDHLLAAYRLTNDPFGRHLIELALVYEGQKIARDDADCCAAAAAPARGFGTGT